MNDITIFIIGYAGIAVLALLINDFTHRHSYEEQREHFAGMVQSMNRQLDALESSNTVLLARQEHFQTEIAGLLDANFQLQRANEALRRDLEADAELKEMFGAG